MKELQPAPNVTMEAIDSEKVETYLRLRSARSLSIGRFKNKEAVLVAMGCAVTIKNAGIVPTNAGILFLGMAAVAYYSE